MPFHHWNILFSNNLDVAYSFLQSVLATVEWNFAKRKSTWFSMEWNYTCDLFLATWMPFHYWNRLFSHNWGVANLCLQAVLFKLSGSLSKQRNTVTYIVFPLYSNQQKVTSDLFLATWMPFYNWNRLFFPQLGCLSPQSFTIINANMARYFYHGENVFCDMSMNSWCQKRLNTCKDLTLA